MAVENVSSSICSCLQFASQGVLDQMTSRVNKIISDKTRLNNLLSRAPNYLFPPGDLASTLSATLEIESVLNDKIADGFPFPGGGDISLGEVQRCLQNQIRIELDAATILDKVGIGNGFCNLCRFAHLLEGIVDDFLPRLDARVSFGCDPATTASLQSSLTNILGSVGADITTGQVTVGSLIGPSLPHVGQAYLDDFESFVNCCLNITDIVTNVKNFITDPFSGDPFNIVTFDSTVFGKASLGSQDLINAINPNDPGAITLTEEEKMIAQAGVEL
jgi:hypothetical protein